MTAPDNSSPDGSLAVGMFAARQAQTEEQARNEATDGAWKGSWNGAQANMRGEFVSATLVNGEVARLDNRIDQILIGTERAIRYTYSTPDVWTKHPAAYKVEVECFSGATGGRQGVSTDTGVGGFGGGRNQATFTGSALADLPLNVSVSPGAGAPGNGGNAGDSWFGTYVSSGGATTTNYGTGNRTYKMRGGTGSQSSSNYNGTDGSAGPFHPGGSGGPRGTQGGHGFSVTVGQVGNGSAGGGGGGPNVAGSSGGPGGHGGWPGGPGGGGGYGSFAAGGAGGNGASGMVVVTVYLEDTLGVPPSTPTGLVASSVTSTSAHVAWDASTDDVMVKNYVLYLNGTRYGVVDTLFHDFVGLSPSTAYAVRVQAVDLGDNYSEMSAVLNFTTSS